jgi:hypothetical protein
MRTRIIAVIAVFGVLLTAGIASANGDDTDIATANGDDIDSRVDTLFTYGYDAETQLFFANTHATDATLLDCTLTGTLSAVYEYSDKDDQDGVVAVDQLSDGPDPVMFDPTGYDLAEEIKAATESTPYDAGGECGISGVTVGSQGHINHGQFMKLLNEFIDMRGGGCLNRSLAQSDLGKDDQQVKTEDFTDPVIGSDGTIDFVTVAADCYHGNRDKAEDHPGRGHEKDDTATATSDNGPGRPDPPGKSDNAAGRNKNK